LILVYHKLTQKIRREGNPSQIILWDEYYSDARNRDILRKDYIPVSFINTDAKFL
jgi:hypothetical protein